MSFHQERKRFVDVIGPGLRIYTEGPRTWIAIDVPDRSRPR